MMLVRPVLSVLLAAALAVASVPCASVAQAQAAQPSGEEAAAVVLEGAAEDYTSDGIIVVKKEQPAAANALSAESEAEEDGEFVEALESASDGVSSVEMLTDDAALVEVSSAEDAYGIAQEIASRPDVARVQPNYVYVLPEESMDASALEDESASEDASASEEQSDSDAAPAEADARAATDDPYLSQQWYLDAVGLTNAWGRVQTQGTVSVAVLDAQFNVNHEDLQGSLDLENAYNAMPDDFDQVTGTAKHHGTRVASVLGAVCGNGVGVSGASYNANIIPVNVFSSDNGRKATTATIAQGLQHVLNLVETKPELNIRVINMSLGGYGSLSQTGSDQLLFDLVHEAVSERGIAVVAAGGNGNTDAFSWPADWDDVISVTSLNQDGQTRAWFSDYNEYKDIAAPGVSMLTADASGTSGYSSDNGSSFSAPLVSGTLALMFAANPDLTVARATEILYETAVDIGEAGVDDQFGHGRLDADAAVRQALLENPRASLRYQDVDQGAWYQTPIGYLDFAVSNGILMGAGNLLRPDDSLTRAEAMVVLWRVFDPSAANAYRSDDAVLRAPFSDAASFEWYTGALNWAYANDVAHGYGNGLFGCGDAVSVEQLCTFLANQLADDAAVASADTARLDGCLDGGSVSAYARQSVAWCLNEGLINGYETPSGAVLAPQESLSRARLAGLMHNAYAANGGSMVSSGV